MKTRKTTAFYLESLLLTFFFLLLLTVLVRMFAAARGLGLQARQETQATLIAQNVCARLTAAQTDGTTESLARALEGVATENAVQLRYNGQGVPENTGEYIVIITPATKKTEAGTLFSYTVEVSGTERAEPLFTLETAAYRPDTP